MSGSSDELSAEEVFARLVAAHGERLDALVEEWCAAHPALAAGLRERVREWRLSMEELGQTVTYAREREFPSIAGSVDAEGSADAADVHRVLQDLVRRQTRLERYEWREEIAVTQMSRVDKVWDPVLRRTLVVKSMLPRRDDDRHEQRLARFVQEVQVTGQLDHPGIPAVHEMGLGATGDPNFVMPLVRGMTFREVIQRVHEGDREWTLDRALRSLIRVCEAVGFAHEHGVLHRDLKSSNVMVGRFGETYVMDWGLARVLGSDDIHALEPADSMIRRDEKDSTDPSGVPETDDGSVLGTAEYMPPEQAHGNLDALDTRSDVYSIGAILYHLLANRAPYTEPGRDVSPWSIVCMVRLGPPKPLLDIESGVPQRLVRICERAMARQPHDRYETAMDLAQDLEAYLSDRPAKGTDVGRWEIVALAIRRNRGIVATAAAALLVLAVWGMFYMEQDARASERNDRLTDFKDAAALLAQVETQYPVLDTPPEVHRRWDGWVRDLLSRRGIYAAELARGDSPSAPSGAELQSMVDSMDDLAELWPQVRDHHQRVRARWDGVREEAQSAWEKARVAIAESERYPTITAVSDLPEALPGVVPLRADPATGFWEFWHVATGERPAFEAGEPGYEIARPTGIVLVLLPGGATEIGPLIEAPGDPNERVQRLELKPFFLAKYETTQGQWGRTMLSNNSFFCSGWKRDGVLFTPEHPVEQVDWNDVMRFGRRTGLTLPTEPQWEYAARAGSRAERKPLTDADGASLENVGSGDDGHDYTAPVGMFPPNELGIHDIGGNVAEWCLGPYEETPDYGDQPSHGDVRHGDDNSSRVHRGASLASPFPGVPGPGLLAPETSRTALRSDDNNRAVKYFVGVRMALRLESF